jgi:hypothetical protein
MATLTQFIPNSINPFQWLPVLDGQVYTVIVKWVLGSQRYYLLITDSFGNDVLFTPLIASPDNYNINMIGGFFSTSSLVYRKSTNNFEVSP